ncbi:hypothetical protein [Endobacterium cereale]|uniref:hypothetical protein n=1 Tax=Endobacterium cereale TaxID=2663029 RepID=UPI002B46E666|nr:hypothetical protein [Endobacterium cereale]MEB2843796.1 hypothetical protein [Endobacterium cereale]
MTTDDLWSRGYNLLPNSPVKVDGSLFQPFIDSLESDDEQYHSMVLIMNLVQLNGFVNDYTAAVALHAFVIETRNRLLDARGLDLSMIHRKQEGLRLWDEMAGRDAAMTVFHFGKTLHNVRTSLRRTPTIKDKVNDDDLRNARRELERQFRHYEIARDAVGHRAESLESVEKIKRDSVRDSSGHRYQMGYIEGDNYVATYKGQKLSVGLDEKTLRALTQIARQVYSAFPAFIPMLPKLDHNSDINI